MERFEGSGVSKLRQAITKIGFNDYDRYELGTITSISPITVRLDNSPLILDAADLVIAEQLTEHRRYVLINGGEPVEMVVDSPLKAGDRVILVSTNSGQSYVMIDRTITNE